MTLKATFPVDRVKKMENKSQDSVELLPSKAAITDIQVAAVSGALFHFTVFFLVV